MASERYPGGSKDREEDPLLSKRKWSSDDGDLERGDHYYATSASFEEEQIAARHQFVSATYAVLLCQLLFTTAICLLFALIPEVAGAIKGNKAIFWSVFAVALALFLCMICFASKIRQHSRSIAALVVFTLAESALLGVITAFYSTYNVLIALCITCVVTFGISLFACQNTFDFASAGTYLYVMFIVVLCFAVLGAVFRSRVLTMMYISLGIFVFSCYLVYDTQLMIGNRHAYVFGYDEVSWRGSHLKTV